MMIDKVPFCGEFINGTHHLLARVYFADTDFSGVVYHARYLEFLERGRSEFLRLSGIHHGELANNLNGEKLAWVVRKLGIEYHKYAVIDDILHIETRINKIGGARIIMEQTIVRNGLQLVFANVEIALINSSGRPRRIPEEFIKNWRSIMPKSN